MAVHEAIRVNTVSLQREVKDALLSCSVYDADSFVVVSLFNELRNIFKNNLSYVDRWNVISEIERQIGGFYVYERRSSDFIWSITFRKHLNFSPPKDK